MDKDEIVQILKEYPNWYQKIRLPFGLETSGRDRSRIANRIFPPNLDGASVLDIGCAEGFFCFEAKKRNAGRVVGVDIDKDRLGTAIKLGNALDTNIEFLQRSVMDVEELGMFDYVLCLNILHHVTDPIHVIHKLVNITRRKLVLEVADIRLKFSPSGFRSSKALLGFWGPLFKSTPSALRPGILVVDSHGRFLMTRKWVKNFFQNLYFNVEKLDFINSDRPNRYLVLVSIRDLSTLRLVSGPTSVGKSEFVQRLKSGDREVSQLLDLDVKQYDWQVTTASRLQANAEGKMNKLLLHYDICRPISLRYGNYEYDPVLTIMRVAAEKTAYVLVCPSDLLIARLKEVLDSYGRPELRQIKKTERLIFEYCQPDRFRKLYEDWISYCKAHYCKVKYIDVSSRKVKAITEEEALKMIG